MNVQEKNTFNMVAQFAHFFAGMAIVLLANLFWASIDRDLLAVGLWIVYAAIKEFWYDYHFETAEIRGSSLEDFVFQAMGALVALFLILIRI